MELDKLAPALVALQADLKPVGKTADNPFFKSKYAALPEIMHAIQPLLAKHRLAVSQFVSHINGQSAIRTILLHESGQAIEDTGPLMLPKNDPQGQGSAITYARRYGVMAVLGLVADNDDDGNAATRQIQQEEESEPLPPLADMRQRVNDASAGLTLDEIAAAYKEWSGGLSVMAASVPQLQKYLDHLLGKSKP